MNKKLLSVFTGAIMAGMISGAQAADQTTSKAPHKNGCKGMDTKSKNACKGMTPEEACKKDEKSKECQDYKNKMKNGCNSKNGCPSKD